ncbi:MAG TPA: anti-sigma factor, partial [Vicinamibacterales bacterium]|nr:anti-sigma factor [Vicinamibacterales bacterium]
MTTCPLQTDGVVELYFYDELSPGERQDLARHLPSCADCRAALEELHVISLALAERPQVSSPPGGDWSSLMARIDQAVAVEPARALPPVAAAGAATSRRSVAGLVAIAATIALVSSALVYQGLDGRRAAESSAGLAAVTPAVTSPDVPGPVAIAASTDRREGFAAVSEEHFERSKLVIL